MSKKETRPPKGGFLFMEGFSPVMDLPVTHIIAAALLLAVLATTAASCRSDVRTLRIPNRHSLIVLGCFAVAFAVAPDIFGAWWEHLGAGLLMFVVTYLMFAFGMMGGGDSKLGSALALWVGLQGLLPYVFYMAVAGGLVAAASLYIKKKKSFAHPLPQGWVDEVQKGRNALPYGIAISAGFWLAILHTGFLYEILDEVFKLIH